jgi:hypothetical protein
MITNKTLRQTWWRPFSHSQKQYQSRTSALSLQFTAHTWFSAADTKDTQTSLRWNHRDTNYKIIITNWLTVTKYPFLKWKWIFFLLRRFLVSSSTGKTLIGHGYVINTVDCCIRWGTANPSRTPGFGYWYLVTSVFIIVLGCFVCFALMLFVLVLCHVHNIASGSRLPIFDGPLDFLKRFLIQNKMYLLSSEGTFYYKS